MMRVGQDIRYAFRVLARSPLFAAVSVLTLAIGIGANTAVFAVLYPALLGPLPFPDSDRLVVAAPVAPGVFLDWQRQSRTFEAMAAYRVGSFDATASGSSERVNGAVVTAQFFDVLGVKPVLGRSFIPDDARGGTRTAVLSHAYWKQRYGADREVIGGTAVLDGDPFTIVGVMPPGIDFPFEIQVWTLALHVVPGHPLHPLDDPTNVRGSLYLGVCGRLAAGVSMEQARAEQRAVFERVRAEYPTEFLTQDVDLILHPMREWLLGDLRAPILWLALAVGLVFLAACANIGSLLLARANSRRREMAIRAAIGASARQIAAQVFTECAVLGAIAGGVGTCLAAWLLPTLVAVGPDDLRIFHPSVGAPVLLFGGALSIAAGLLFGCAPALIAGRLSVVSALTSSRSRDGLSGRRTRGAFLALEFGVSLALLVAAELLIGSFMHLRSVDPGFQPASLQTVSVVLPATRYTSPNRQRMFFGALLDAVGRLPGVEAVAATGRLPFGGVDSTRAIVVEGADAPHAWGGIRVISPDYFRVMGIRLRHGRWLRDDDRADAPRVAVINEAMAHRYWPAEDPIGHRFRLGDGGPLIEIVGEVADSRFASLREPAEPEFYLPYRQEPWAAMSLVIRTRLDAGAVSVAVSQVIRGLDGNLAVPAARPLSALLNATSAVERLETLGITAFALLTVLLASMGLYGVTAYVVGQRTREVGIRIALGAVRGTVIRQLVLDALRPLAPGLVGGVCLAFLGARLIRSELFGVSSSPPYALVGLGTVMLAVVALAASAVPAWRAARIEPASALRMQ